MKRLFRLILYILIFSCGFFVSYLLNIRNNEKNISINKITEKPLDKYSIENLSKQMFNPGKISITKLLKENKNYNSYLFEFSFNPNLDGKTMKRITGQINIPSRPEAFRTGGQDIKYPLILMFRGYVDQQLYQTGDGTRNAAAYFADNGFITIAPDFLGYGNSDPEADNIFESRFQTYVTSISLLMTLEKLNDNQNLLEISKEISYSNQVTKLLTNEPTIFLWAHSNGGQIALTILEITAANFPTTVWAPVSKPFPYSILYYTDESDDRGKLIRRELSSFEKDYDVEKYSLTNYFDNIQAPIQIQQGMSDEEVPISWSDQLVKLLKDKDIKVIYNTYGGTDHNMRPLWNTTIQSDLKFFQKYL